MHIQRMNASRAVGLRRQNPNAEETGALVPVWFTTIPCFSEAAIVPFAQLKYWRRKWATIFISTIQIKIDGLDSVSTQARLFRLITLHLSVFSRELLSDGGESLRSFYCWSTHHYTHHDKNDLEVLSCCYGISGTYIAL